MRWHLVATAVAASALAAPVLAQSPRVACTIPETALVRSDHFPELQREALSLNQTLCLSFLRRAESDIESDLRAQLLSFAIKAGDAARSAFEGFPVQDLSVPFDRFTAAFSQPTESGMHLPAFRVDISEEPNAWLLFHFDDPATAGRLALPGHNGACRTRFRADCDAVLDDLAIAINFYRYSYASLTAADAVDRLNRLSDRWDAFLESGRSQTLLDLTVTTVIERGEFRQGYLVAPPKRQWALLHPDLGYEHIRRAPSGHRDSLSIVVEWFGVNWWSSDSPLGNIPFGVSLASVYADRPDLPSAGHGLVFHLDNKYSLGWTRRGGSDGFFLSIDLLRLVDNKRERLDRYRRRLERKNLIED